MPLPQTRASFESAFPGLAARRPGRPPPAPGEVRNGSVVIAAITSCTNTSNPTVMVGAGLLAAKAVARGLRVNPAVKTSLAPGSRAVTAYLERAGLTEPLAELGFALAGYGCTTCIGNSGPLDDGRREPDRGARADRRSPSCPATATSRAASTRSRARATSRRHPSSWRTRSPAGSTSTSRASRWARTRTASPVFLADLWPSADEVRAAIADAVDGELFRSAYASVFEGDARWRALPIPDGDRYAWDPDSTYVANPPFFAGMTMTPDPIRDIEGARVLAWLGDSVTTDHISPAGSIAAWSPAGAWLQQRGVAPLDFNSYGSRRGHHEVMMRGTFGNIRLRNRLVDGKEGPYTLRLPTPDRRRSSTTPRWPTRRRACPSIVLAGREYGSGSSRDWAAKGTRLLGIRAVIAESFERIHRSNLVGMGVLPLQFRPGQSAATPGPHRATSATRSSASGTAWCRGRG